MPSTGSNPDTPSGGRLVDACRQLQDMLAQRFASHKTERRTRFLLLLLTIFILTLLITPEHEIPARRYKMGEVALSDIRAGRDYLLEDKKLTAEAQAEAVAKVQLVYELDESVPEEIVEKLRKSLISISSAKSARQSLGSDEQRRMLSEQLGVELTPSEIVALGRIKDDSLFLHDAGNALHKIYKVRVTADMSSFLSDQLNGIALYKVDGTKLTENFSQDPIDLEQARRQLLKSRFAASSAGAASGPLEIVVSRMLKPSLAFNRVRTDEMKSAAKLAVSPSLIQVKRGEMIVRSGDRISNSQEMKLASIAAEASVFGHFCTMVGVMGIALVLLYFPYRFALKNIRKFKPSNKDLLLLVCLILGHFTLLRTFYAITPLLGGVFPTLATSIYIYLFPFAITAILVRLFINSEVALVYCAITAPLNGLLYGSLPVVLFSLITSIIGAHGVRHCDNRSIVFTTGLKVSVVSMAMALSFQLVDQSIFSFQTVYALSFAFIGGIATAVLASGAIPLLESLFNYTTDIKLLELTNLNSPLLRELMVNAPGTYHHSVVVGNLVEAAAEAINANPLLARVAAYYHDIGKISKAQYFIENQSSGENRHDRLSPNMSALILTAHVKEGAELARQHRLGEQLVDIIRQSHGTALIKYFYSKAQEQTAGGKTVDEHEFRYPGPKPQTREAGLVLLADAVEAASRTLVDANPARIQGLVQKIINNIFIDGQLDECELTLKNLHQIAWSFNQILNGIHHQRIGYPQPAYKEKCTGGKKESECCDSEPAKTAEDRDEAIKNGSSEDLRRLGMYF